jgi:hypothetical protein
MSGRVAVIRQENLADGFVSPGFGMAAMQCAFQVVY